MLRLHGPVYQFGVRDKISNVRGTNIFFMLSPEAICMDSPVLSPFLVGQGLPKRGAFLYHKQVARSIGDRYPSGTAGVACPLTS